MTTTFKMPEPDCFTMTLDGQELDSHSTDQLKQALRDVLEQAAQECETQEDYGPRHETPRDCAAAIRAMIGEIK